MYTFLHHHLAHVNIFVFLFQLGSALVIGVLYNRDATTYLTHSLGKSVNGTNDQRLCSEFVEAYTTHLTGTYAIGPFISTFLVLDALQYLLQLAFFDYYKNMITQQINLFRWIQYKFSASLMNVMISWLNGTTDVFVLLVVFLLTLFCMCFGLLAEYFSPVSEFIPYTQLPLHDLSSKRAKSSKGDKKGSKERQIGKEEEDNERSVSPGVSFLGIDRIRNKTLGYLCFALGTFPFVVIWTLYLFTPFFYNIISANHKGGASQMIPSWIYAIIFILFFLECLFAVNQWLGLAQVGPWRYYITVEYGYIFLSVVAKQMLAWMIFGGQYNIHCSSS